MNEALGARFKPHAEEPVIEKRATKSQTKAIPLSFALLPVVRIIPDRYWEVGHRDSRIADAESPKSSNSVIAGNNFHLEPPKSGTSFSTVRLPSLVATVFVFPSAAAGAANAFCVFFSPETSELQLGIALLQRLDGTLRLLRSNRNTMSPAL